MVGLIDRSEPPVAAFWWLEMFSRRLITQASRWRQAKAHAAALRQLNSAVDSQGSAELTPAPDQRQPCNQNETAMSAGPSIADLA